MRNVSRFGVVFLLYWLFMKSSCIYLPWLALEWLSRAFHLAFTTLSDQTHIKTSQRIFLSH